VRHMWDECDGVVHLIYMSMVYVNMYKMCHFAYVCRARACLCLQILTTNFANYVCV
jgi:hypothetical protein